MILFQVAPAPIQPDLRHLHEPPEAQEKQRQGPEQGWESPMLQDRLRADSVSREGLEDPGGQQESGVSMQERGSAASWGCIGKSGKWRDGIGV